MQKILNSFKDCIWKNFSKDEGKMLVYMGALGWIFSSAAQTVAIITNPKISRKEKSFLVPQEIFDGIVNVGLYFGVTQFCRKGVVNLMKNGHLQIVNKAGKNITSNYIAGAGILATVAGSVVACNLLTPLARNYMGALYQKHHIAKNLPPVDLALVRTSQIASQTIYPQIPPVRTGVFKNFIMPV